MALAVLTPENFLSVTLPVITWIWQSLEYLPWEASVVFCWRRAFSSGILHALFTSRSSHRATYLLRCLLKQVKGSSLNLKIRVEFSVILFMYICVCACMCTSGNRQLELGKNCTFCYLSCFPADSIQNCLYISPSMGRACCVSPSLKDTIFISGIAHMYFSDTW